MIFDPEQLSAETQRRVFLRVIQALAEMERPVLHDTTAPLALGAALDGLLEVIATLLVEAQVLPNERIERQVCDDLRDALLAHIKQSRACAEASGDIVRH